MAAKTWNVDRQKGGSYEFSLDASGNYKLNSVGFNKVKTLNLPEIKKDTTTAATTTKDTKTASAQTKKAFGDVQPFYYDKKGEGGGGQYTSEYQMTKDKSLATDQATSTRPEMLGDYGGSMVKDTRPSMLGDYGGSIKRDTTPAWAQDADKRGYENINKVDTVPADKKQIGRVNVDNVLAERANQTQVDKFSGVVGPKKQSPYQDAIMRGQRGVKYEKPGIPQKATEVTQTALKQVKTGLKPLAKAIGFVMSPISSTIGMVAGAIKETPMNKHDKTYFNINPAEQGGRISGNPATDLYAGMNRVSASGNLNKAGNKRINTRNSAKTQARLDKLPPERKAAFNAKTKEMQKQAIDYQKSQTKVMKNVPPSQRGGGGGSGGGGNARVICTELHSTGEMSTRDWIRDIRFTYKDLSKEHIKGYLLWAVPTVEHIKKYPTYRKFWKHVAQHRANDIAWRLNQGKFDLLGRIYAGIGEPLCWLIGKCISDKQIKELELNNWRQA